MRGENFFHFSFELTSSATVAPKSRIMSIAGALLIPKFFNQKVLSL